MEPIYSIELHNGQAWSAVIQKGKIFKLTSLNDNPNVALLCYNANQPLDRYNMPDTLKGQHISKLCKGSCLHSDMGRLLLSIVDSSCAWHDPIGGLSTEAEIVKKFGHKTFAEVRNDYYRNGYDNFLTELGKHGLGKRDIVPNVNLFSKVYVNEDGSMHFEPQTSGKGDYVSLRTEMKVLVVLSNTPHPLFPKGNYPGGNIKIEVFESDVVDAKKDICYQSRPENFRAWETTQAYLNLSE